MRDMSEPEYQKRFVVDLLYDGRRLDKFLRFKLHWRSRSEIRKKIERGEVLLNGKPAKPSQTLKEGDEVVVLLDVPDVDLDKIPVETLFEDEHIWIVNKPAGVMCHPTGRHIFGTVLNVLFKRMKERGELTEERKPHLCHRLDLHTSGVLVAAKTLEARRALQEAFEKDQVAKFYLAVVEGIPEPQEGRIDAPIAPIVGAPRLKMEVTPHGYPSLTLYRVVERFACKNGANFSLVECDLKTGRTHQIRIHLAHIGHPVVCDEIYGVRTKLQRGDLGLVPSEEVIIERQALHAHRLIFKHPITGKQLEVEAPLPEDMRRLLAALRQASRSA